MNLAQFLNILKLVGLEYFQKYYSVYSGVVEDNNDPDQLGRIKLSIPGLFGKGKALAQWAEPVGRDLAGSKTGCFFPPYIGDVVDVMFENGNINAPRFMGGFWATDELPDDFLSDYPNVRGWVFKSKQKFLFNETDSKLTISLLNGPNGAVLLFDKDNKAWISSQKRINLSVKSDTEPKEPLVLGLVFQDFMSKTLQKLEDLEQQLADLAQTLSDHAQTLSTHSTTLTTQATALVTFGSTLSAFPPGPVTGVALKPPAIALTTAETTVVTNLTKDIATFTKDQATFVQNKTDFLQKKQDLDALKQSPIDDSKVLSDLSFTEKGNK